MKFPALVGELVAGITLGVIFHHYSSTFPVLSNLPENEVFKGLTDLAIFFLMLLAGVELRPKDIVKASGPAFAIAVGGMIVPLMAGMGLGIVFLPESSLKMAQALFLGTALAITAVPVSVKILMDLKLLDTKIGKTIVSAALFDDILSLVLLAVLTAILANGEIPGVDRLLLLVGKVILFFITTSVLGLYVLPALHKLAARFKSDEFEFSALLMVSFLFALLAEELGMHFILGAFLAGLFFVKRIMSDEVYDTIKASLTSWTMGFFAPIFFASIGLHLDLAAISEIPLFLSMLLLAAFLGKLVGAGLPALAVGFTPAESIGIGSAMSARGAVELIIATIALEAGLFNHPDPAPPEVSFLFSAIVIMALVTTLVTPVLMRFSIGNPGHNRAQHID
ncbi:cation:proton antiporter [Desulfopila sp. IMCC35008]|uniref:cation:proton antiporter n=1 Tax=Desulfopila sp. IMCC35008 TaxID=2653858 RepID=UPI001F0F92B3|nr:cation:proton antiporter [Desulfopila sp. IMCC35008]